MYAYIIASLFYKLHIYLNKISIPTKFNNILTQIEYRVKFKAVNHQQILQ